MPTVTFIYSAVLLVSNRLFILSALNDLCRNLPWQVSAFFHLARKEVGYPFTADVSAHEDYMKSIKFKKALVAASVLGVLGVVGSASADDQAGSLGKAASATDYYQVICTENDDHLYIQVRDDGPQAKPLVSVLAVGSQIKNSTDTVDGDAKYSPLLNIKGGSGTYHVFVSKTSAGFENYSLIFHCYDSSNNHTQTDIYPFQDQ